MPTAPSNDCVTLRRLTANPFFVLDVPVDTDVEQAETVARRLIDGLEVGRPDVAEYPTPLGPRRRDALLVWRALEALRDPETRIRHEFWAAASAAPRATDEEQRRPWNSAPTAFGWRPR